jgi:phosphotransferase family enzyme
VTGAVPAHWADPTWRRAIETWAAEQLAASGRVRTGPVTQPHARPWSTVLRIPTDAGPVWGKAARPGTAHEARLLPAFAAWGIPSVLPPIAADPERGWLLLPDGGTTLRQTRPDNTGDQDLDAWERVIAEYATLQRGVETRAEELLALGVPDGRPATLPGTLARLLDDEATWDRVAEPDRDEARRARGRLRGAADWVAARVDVLERSGNAATIQHDDLHSGNVFVGADGYRFFDWGDAVVAHPFATLVTTLNSIAFRLGITAEDPMLSRLRDAYLEAWTDVAPRPALGDTLAAALDLGRIGKAAAWDRALSGLDLSEMDGHGDAPAGWLMDLAERLDR